MRSLAAFLLVAVAFSGCLSSDAPGDDDGDGPGDTLGPVVEPDWARRAVFGPDFIDRAPGDPVDHDHSDRGLHNATTNFEVVGWDPLSTGHHGRSAGGYYCGEVSRDGDQKLAVVNSFTSQVAMVVMDVTDPAAPQKLGELVLPNAHVYDSAISDDGDYAVLATSPLVTAHEDSDAGAGQVEGAGGTDAAGPADAAAVTAGPDGSDSRTTEAPRQDDGDAGNVRAATASAAPGDGAVADDPSGREWDVRPEWHDACGGVTQGPLDVLPFVSGVMLVDIRDPSAPEVADFVSQPAIGPHSVSATTIDDTRYVVASTTNLVYTASFFSVFTIEEAAETPQLVPFAEYSANYDQQVEQGESPSLLLNGHVDATLEDHPSGDLILWAANWDGGLHAVRLDGPGQATQIDVFGARDPARGAITGAIHSAQPVGERDGRAYLLTGQEVGGSLSHGDEHRPTGQIVLLDTTDPGAVEPVARWTLPVNVSWSGDLHMSTHYMTMVGDTLFVANYHNGVWAADASPEHWPDLPSTGVFMPTYGPPGGAATDTSYAPYVLDVLSLEGGEVLVYDSTSGAYTVRYTGPGSVPPAAPWPDNAYIG